MTPPARIGSTSVTVDANGNRMAEMRYTAWGEARYEAGTTPTDYRYTGQREEGGLGLYYYNARWMDPELGRFVQADNIVPGGAQGLDRYAYGNNDPVNNIDPSGYATCSDDGYCGNLSDTAYQMHIYRDAMSIFNWSLDGNWSLNDLKTIYQTGTDVSNVVGGAENMIKMFGNVIFSKKVMSNGGEGDAHHIWLNSDSSKWNSWSIAHELGHAWDGANGWNFSKGLQETVHSTYPMSLLGLFFISYGNPGDGPGATGWPVEKPAQGWQSWDTWDELKRWDRREDFAQSFAAYLYPGIAANHMNSYYGLSSYGPGYSSFFDTPRGQYIADLLP